MIASVPGHLPGQFLQLSCVLPSAPYGTYGGETGRGSFPAVRLRPNQLAVPLGHLSCKQPEHRPASSSLLVA